MNQRVAKRLRKEISYDTNSITTYEPIFRKKGGKIVNTGDITCNGLRGRYLDLKKEYKENRRNN